MIVVLGTSVFFLFVFCFADVFLFCFFFGFSIKQLLLLPQTTFFKKVCSFSPFISKQFVIAALSTEILVLVYSVPCPTQIPEVPQLLIMVGNDALQKKQKLSVGHSLMYQLTEY